jgi:hypothetical protein
LCFFPTTAAGVVRLVSRSARPAAAAAGMKMHATQIKAWLAAARPHMVNEAASTTAVDLVL